VVRAVAAVRERARGEACVGEGVAEKLYWPPFESAA
jgi:hypothetical protein